MKIYLRSYCLITALLLSVTGWSQTNTKAQLKLRIQKIIDTSGGQIGIAVTGLDFKDSIIINGAKKLPMQSVYKFPLAIAILHAVDKGQLSLTQIIHIPKESLDTATWSPMVRDYPRQNINMTLADVLRYSVSKSDNNACDILFRIAKGTASVNKFIHGLGINGIAIAATEAEMKKAWKVQYTNWCQPVAMIQLLRVFYEGKVLSHTSNELLMKLMTESENSSTRIKGLLPRNTIVAHKTGTSNTNAQGITAATNDVGIVTLPNGQHYAIVVYVSDFKGGTAKGERIIAAISKLVWEYFNAS